MSLVRFDYSVMGETIPDEYVLDLLPVLEKEKLLLVEEDPSVEQRHLHLDTHNGVLAGQEPLKLIITHQILVPMNLTVYLHLRIDQSHEIEIMYIQEIMTHDVTTVTKVKGVIVDKASLVCNSQIVVQGDHQNIAVRTEKKFTVQDRGRVSSRPELTNLRRGMRASHGLTISGLDQRQLYFMMSRGLPEQWSKELLLS